MQNFLIIYDIFDKKRLPKIKKIAYSYALGGQKSALEAPLDKSLMTSLIKELEDILEDEDKVNIVKVANKTILLGKAKQVAFEKNGVIIL
ncbi:CRISPR-associated endonuclease Cas2 [Sulfurimonas sp. NW15]|uniref:CRISPR-associated endonuclease Cas2 n=1 Tax=Sulfurimonas TaxID=202746 RepID=UPI00125EF983|nr:CRISPR-associated endonuclease Cas2 [Sulfurimonas hydrogeniphila]